MSRAVRRQQQATPKEAPPKRNRSLGIRTPRTTRGARPATAPKKRFQPRAPTWASDIWSELKKVSWPSRQETMYLTSVVIVVTLFVGTLLGGIDIGFNWLIDHLLLR